MMDIVGFGPATRTLAALVGGVADDQLGDPTACPKWTTTDLLRHIDGLTLEFTAAAQKVPTPARAGDGHRRLAAAGPGGPGRAGQDYDADPAAVATAR